MGFLWIHHKFLRGWESVFFQAVQCMHFCAESRHYLLRTSQFQDRQELLENKQMPRRRPGATFLYHFSNATKTVLYLGVSNTGCGHFFCFIYLLNKEVTV